MLAGDRVDAGPAGLGDLGVGERAVPGLEPEPIGEAPGTVGHTVTVRFDRTTGDARVIREGGGDPGGNTVDLLDESAEVTIQHGGRAFVLGGERMPTNTGVAAILR